MGLPGLPNGQQLGSVQQTPPQYVPPQQQQYGGYGFPPQPFKEMRFDGASVVRSVFQNCQQTNTDVGSAPGSAGDHVLGSRNLFPGPPPAPLSTNLVASTTHNGPGSVASENT